VSLRETNPIWAPLWQSPLEMAEAYRRTDPIERTLRTIWSYETAPVRICRTQRYSLVLTEPPARQP